MAQLLFIVSRTELRAYTIIQQVFADERRNVTVILDRRGCERRRSQGPPSAERRRIERRHRDVTSELQSSGWAVVRRVGNPVTLDAIRCVEPDCQEEGVVGLNGALLCLTHFDIRFEAMKTPPPGLAGPLTSSLEQRPSMP